MPRACAAPTTSPRCRWSPKQNYLTRHPLGAAWPRRAGWRAATFIAVSSGTTGKPTFWPRFLSDELADRRALRTGFHDSFLPDQRRTAGRGLLRARHLGGRHVHGRLLALPGGQGLSDHVVTPGNNREEIWRVARELAPQFEQTCSWAIRRSSRTWSTAASRKGWTGGR